MFRFVGIVLLSQTAQLQADDPLADNCKGCSAGLEDGGIDCYNLQAGTNNNNVFACRGTYGVGMFSSSAESICANGYHVCESANEAATLGLTLENCSNLPSDEVFLSQESSPGNGRCESVYGTGGNNDIWGCGGTTQGIGAGQSCWNSFQCNVFPVSCGQVNTPGFITFLGDTVNELNDITFHDSSRGGVLCCTNGDTQAPTVQPSEQPTEQPFVSILPCDQLVAPHKCDNEPCSEDEATNCQVYNDGTGCSQCIGNHFQKSHDYTCQDCQNTFGSNCMHCANIHGCQQCKQGSTRVYNQGYKLWCCQTNEPQ